MIRLFEAGYRSLQTGEICKTLPKGFFTDCGLSVDDPNRE
jgi:hypothetical protein